MLLKPAPVRILQFAYYPPRRMFHGEMSDTHGFGRVYDDSCDEGLTVVSDTGREVVFVVHDEHTDAEGDITHWDLKSTCGTYRMVLFND